MNRLVFTAAALIALALDSALLPVLQFGSSWPSSLAVLVTFMCIGADRSQVPWAALFCGLAVDLSTPVVGPEGEVLRLIGPNALGFAFGSTLVLSMRGMLLRRSPWAIGAATLAFLLANSVVMVAIWSARYWLQEGPMPWPPGGALGEMVHLSWAAILSALAGIPLGFILIRSTPVWGFPPVGSIARR